MIRVAWRQHTIDDYFISNHNRGKLIDEEAWDEYNEAKEIYRAALDKFHKEYHK
jgi:lactate dehydrogenase-like 2-hydroxyacid dehydrogenase